MVRQQQNGIRLVKTGEIPEVAVLAERIFCIAAACYQRSSRDHYHAFRFTQGQQAVLARNKFLFAYHDQCTEGLSF